MKNLKTRFSIASLLAIAMAMALPAYAVENGGTAKDTPDAKKDMPIGAMSDMTEGEIRKVDIDNQKITIKHGPIKNLDMPGMTMVFQVKDPAMVDRVKPGDKIRFRAEKRNGAIVVSDIQVEK